MAVAISARPLAAHPLGVLVRFVVFMGVAMLLWAWRRPEMRGPSARFLPAATFGVAWVLVYACLAAVCVLCGAEPACRGLVLAAVAVTWAWILARPASRAAGFLLIAAAIALLLAAFGLAGNALARALLALPIAWLVAALVLSGPA
jgi:hypothetical protein